MKNLLSPVLLSLSGYLICVVSLLGARPLNISEDNIGIWWTIGIGLHVIASAIVIKRKGHWLSKTLYLLLPVPLGFFMTFFAAFLTFGLLAQFGWL